MLVALGGFANSGGVFVISLISPLGALVFADRRQAIGWFLAFLALLVGGFFVPDFVPPPALLPPRLVDFLFIANVGVVSIMVFALMHRFVSERAKAHMALQEAHQDLIETQDQLIQAEKMASLG